MYWRTLSAMPQDASKVVLCEKPTIEDSSHCVPASLLDALLMQLSSLASIYHKAPSTFVQRTRQAVHNAAELEELRRAEAEDGGSPTVEGSSSAGPVAGNLLGDSEPTSPASAPLPATTSAAPALDDLLSSLDVNGSNSSPLPAMAAAPAPAGLDPFAGDLFASSRIATTPPLLALPKLCDAAGCEVCGCVALEGSALAYKMQLTNRTTAPMSSFMLQFNRNVMGLSPVSPALPLDTLAPGATAAVSVPLQSTREKLDPSGASAALQIAFKFSPGDVTYIQVGLKVWERKSRGAKGRCVCTTEVVHRP